MDFKNQKGLIEEARGRSSKVFSAEENHNDAYNPSLGRNYFYFPGILYFERGTITTDMVQRLREGASMLSVGSGDGHLERLLSEGFEIPKKNIVVSDIELDPFLSSDFESYTFDMTGDWPDFGRKFDYVLFPESLGVALLDLLNIGNGGHTYRFFEDINSDASRCLNGEEMHSPEFFQRVIEMDIPYAVNSYGIMKRAVSQLNPEGEVRVCYGLDKSDQVRAYVMLKLKQDNPGITFPEPNKNSNFTAKLPKEKPQ